MRTTRQLSITLPKEMANAVKAMVQSGEYATESEVIRDGLRVLMARDRAVENWLHNQCPLPMMPSKPIRPAPSALGKYARALPPSMPNDELSVPFSPEAEDRLAAL